MGNNFKASKQQQVTGNGLQRGCKSLWHLLHCSLILPGNCWRVTEHMACLEFRRRQSLSVAQLLDSNARNRVIHADKNMKKHLNPGVGVLVKPIFIGFVSIVGYSGWDPRLLMATLGIRQDSHVFMSSPRFDDSFFFVVLKSPRISTFYASMPGFDAEISMIFP